MIPEMNSIECLTLFVRDLPTTKKFYEQVFEAKMVFEDPHSAVMGFHNLMVNLLIEPQAPELVEPAKIGSIDSGSRFLLTIKVSDVNATYARLQDLNVKFLNGPIDRPWGRRTAAFQDPAGHSWEIAQEI